MPRPAHRLLVAWQIATKTKFDERAATMSEVGNITLDAAGNDDRAIVWNLLQLYLYDFSAFADPDDPHGKLGPDATFAYPWFDDYWPPSAHHQAYLIRASGALAGFVLVNDWAPSGEAVDNAVAEFFILRKYRRTGIGRRVARSLFPSRPGSWELGVVSYNLPAVQFWRAVLVHDTIHRLEERDGDGVRWNGIIFRFTCR